MMQLEMISQANWKQPIYYAVTVGPDYYQGLEAYFELTGLAYQVTPVRSPDGQARVNTEKMYDNMMHHFAYGNMNQPGIYIDENLMRMCRTHRMMFMQLAEALFEEGQKEKVIEVLDFAEEMLPECNIPYDYTSASMGLLYHYCGETEKAEHILRSVANTAVEYLAYGEALNRSQRNTVNRTIQQQAAILSFVLQHAERLGLDAFIEEFYPAYMQYVNNQ